MARGISLHIGLNRVDPAVYEGWDGQLFACENDAHDMQSVATSLGYRTSILLTPAATRRAVVDEITAAANQLQRDDIFFLTYSGHGGQVPDTNGDEPDHKDETWVLYDGELVDDQLHELYTQFKPGVRIVVFSDSCHSGTVTRLYERIAPIEAEMGFRKHAQMRPKCIPRDIGAAVYDRNRQEFDAIQDRTKIAVQKVPEATIILISGCQDSQTSSDGDVNGLFTEHLLEVWDKGRFRQDYQRLQRAIKRRMPPSQQPNYFVVGAPNKAFEHEHALRIVAAAAIAA